MQRVCSHSSTEAKVSSKTDTSQLQAKCLGASLEKRWCPAAGAALHPWPSACGLGHHFRALGGLGGGSRAQLQPQDSHRGVGDSARQGGHAVSCAGRRALPSPGRATPAPAHSRAGKPARSREERDSILFSSIPILILIWKM